MGLRAKVGFNGNQYTKKDEVTIPLFEEVSGDTVSPPKTTADIAKEAGLTDRSFQRRKQIAADIIPEVQETLAATPIANSTTQLFETSDHTPNKKPPQIMGWFLFTPKSSTLDYSIFLIVQSRARDFG